MSGKFHAALDLSGAAARLSVATAELRAVHNAEKAMKKHDAAILAEWVATELERAQTPLAAIGAWTVGSGPGSFTGMRLAAALVAGLTHGKSEVRTRTAPTALAMAAAAHWDRATAGALFFDGRNRELLLYETATQSAMVLNREQAAAYLATHEFAAYGVQAAELDAVVKLLPTAVATSLQTVETFDLQALLAPDAGEYDGNLSQLLYIRPAVFTAPLN